MVRQPVFHVLIYLLLLMNLPKSSSSRVARQSSGFYTPEDDIIILNKSNINQIIGSPNGWVVEFYSAYCSHCVKMVPRYKKFGKQMKQWNEMVKVAAFNCDNDWKICFHYGARMVPLVKYFPANFQYTETNRGFALEHKQLKQSFLNTIKSEQKNGQGTIYPNIQPYWKSLSNLVQENGGTHSCFLIVQDFNSFIGPKVILDLHGFPNVCVRYTYANNTYVKEYDQLLLPFILTASNSRTVTKTNIEKSRIGFVNYIKSYLV